MADLASIGHVRGSHFMMGMEFVKDKASKETYSEAINIGLLIAQKAQNRGLIARPLGNVLILSPTLIVDEVMIGQAEGVLRESTLAVTAILPA